MISTLSTHSFKGIPAAILSVRSAGSAAFDQGAIQSLLDQPHSMISSPYYASMGRATAFHYEYGSSSASASNSISSAIFSASQLEEHAKEVILALRSSQFDVDLETKALISENLWDLYD